MAKLTAKQEAFVQEYLVDLSQTQAAIRAGYKAMLLASFLSMSSNGTRKETSRPGTPIRTTIASMRRVTVISSSDLRSHQSRFLTERVPLIHRHPADIGVEPLVKAELPEVHLLSGVLFCLLIGSLHGFKW